MSLSAKLSTPRSTPARLTDARRYRLIEWAYICHIRDREADFCIGDRDDPYLLRWFVIRNGENWRSLSPAERAWRLENDDPRKDKPRGRNVFIHQFLRSDDDRALHDHPWPWHTVVLEGEYLEHRPRDPARPAGPTVTHHRRAGEIGAQRAGVEAHRVELIEGGPVLTLFFTGERERDWGFWCQWGWRHWEEFTAPDDSGQVGRGCE